MLLRELDSGAFVKCSLFGGLKRGEMLAGHVDLHAARHLHWPGMLLNYIYSHLRLRGLGSGSGKLL